MPRLAGLPGYPSYHGRVNFSYVSLENALNCLHASQGSLPTWDTRLGGIAFYHVDGSCGAIPAS